MFFCILLIASRADPDGVVSAPCRTISSFVAAFAKSISLPIRNILYPHSGISFMQLFSNPSKLDQSIQKN